MLFPSNDVDAVIGFLEFLKGFDKNALAQLVQFYYNKQKIDGIKVFELLDTLKTMDKIQLLWTSTQFNRQKISTLGYRVSDTKKPTEARNIMG